MVEDHHRPGEQRDQVRQAAGRRAARRGGARRCAPGRSRSSRPPRPRRRSGSGRRRGHPHAARRRPPPRRRGRRRRGRARRRPAVAQRERVALGAPDHGLRADADHRVAAQPLARARPTRAGSRPAVAQLQAARSPASRSRRCSVCASGTWPWRPAMRAHRVHARGHLQRRAGARRAAPAAGGSSARRRGGQLGRHLLERSRRPPATARRGGRAGRRSRRRPGRARRPLSGHDHLGRLLPHLLAHGVDALGEQPRGVATPRGRRPRRGAAIVRSRSASAANGSGAPRRPGGRGSRSPRRCGRRPRSGRPARRSASPSQSRRHRAHGLGVAAGRALVPQLLAGAAPEPGLAALQGALQRLAVHPGQGQHPPAGGVLDDGRDQAVGAEAHPLDQLGAGARSAAPHQATPFCCGQLGQDAHGRAGAHAGGARRRSSPGVLERADAARPP